MFLHIHFYLLKMPKKIPRRPQEDLKRPQDEPKGGPLGPKRGPRLPQDGPKTTLRCPQDSPSPVPGPPSRCQGLPLMFMTAVAAQNSPPEGLRIPPDPPQGPTHGAQEGFKRAPKVLT